MTPEQCLKTLKSSTVSLDAVAFENAVASADANDPLIEYLLKGDHTSSPQFKTLASLNKTGVFTNWLIAYHPDKLLEDPFNNWSINTTVELLYFLANNLIKPGEDVFWGTILCMHGNSNADFVEYMWNTTLKHLPPDEIDPFVKGFLTTKYKEDFVESIFFYAIEAQHDPNLRRLAAAYAPKGYTTAAADRVFTAVAALNSDPSPEVRSAALDHSFTWFARKNMLQDFIGNETDPTVLRTMFIFAAKDIITVVDNDFTGTKDVPQEPEGFLYQLPEQFYSNAEVLVKAANFDEPDDLVSSSIELVKRYFLDKRIAVMPTRHADTAKDLTANGFSGWTKELDDLVKVIRKPNRNKALNGNPRKLTRFSGTLLR